ncbi:MAG: SGNH/GDSL hydrolase family protein [Methylocella sp.]
MARRFSIPLRAAAIPILIALIALMEVKHLGQFYRLFTFIFVFLLLVDIASLTRGKARDFQIVLASIVLGLCILEATADILAAKTWLQVTPGESVRQPIMGWGPEHAGRFHADKRYSEAGPSIYGADYTIDSDLLRQTHSIESGPAIVFFGDSYTFGDGVNDADALPQMLADSLDPKQRVVNLAFTGYGPQQFLREMEVGRFDSVIGPHPKLFIFMTAVWHAERTACKAYWTPHAPRYALENGKVVFKGACNEGASRLAREFLQNTAAYRMFIEPYRTAINHEDVELYIRILEAAVRLAKEKYGVATLVPYLRVSKDYLSTTGFTNEEVIERLQNAGAIVIDASLLDEQAGGAVISIPGDGHPTPLANRLRTSMLKTYIEQRLADVSLSGSGLRQQN